MFVTASEVDDPYNLNIKCTVIRDEKAIYEGGVNTSQINWKFEELTEFLCRDNPVPIGTVVSTGTGIIVPNDLPLAPGDIVEIEADGARQTLQSGQTALEIHKAERFISKESAKCEEKTEFFRKTRFLCTIS